MSKPRRLLAPPVRSGFSPLWAGAAIFGVTLLVYARTLSAGFIWDDAAHVTAPELRSLGGLWRIWTEVGVTQQWYPLLHGFFWVQYHLWGDATAPYHWLNVLMHAGVACLLAAVVMRLFESEGQKVGGSEGPNADPQNLRPSDPQHLRSSDPLALATAWLAAALFALHPVMVESVAWITEQKNTFSTLLYLAAAYCYLGFDRTRDRRSYILATVWFVAAILAKSLTATLPAALLVLFWWQRGKLSWRRDAVPLLPWFASGAAVGLFTGWVEKRFIGAEGAEFGLSLMERVLLSGRTAWFYLGKFSWPTELIFIYPRWKVDAGQGWQWLFPAMTLTLLVGLWWIRGRQRGPLALALLFGGSMVPTIGIFNVYAFRFSYVADHWNYLPSLWLAVGTAAVAVAAWHRLAPALRPWGLGLAVVVLGTLGTLSWRQTVGYHDVALFYRTILATNPDCWLAHNNLGNLIAGDAPDEAAGHFRDAVRLKPDYAEAEYNWGVMLNRHDRVAEAVPHFEAATRIGHGFAPAEYELGVAYAKLGRTQEAITHYETSLRLKPGYAEARNNLALALAGLQQYDKAVAQLREAVKLWPDNPEMFFNLAVVLTVAGRPGEAIAPFEEAVRLRPEHAETHLQYAVALAQLGRDGEARKQAAEGQRLRALGR